MAIVLLTGQAMDTTLYPNKIVHYIYTYKTTRRNETKL